MPVWPGRPRKLFQCVIPIAGVRVDLGRFQQSDLVVVPQRFDTQVGHRGEASDTDGAVHARSVLGCSVFDDEQGNDLAVADPDVVGHDQRIR